MTVVKPTINNTRGQDQIGGESAEKKSPIWRSFDMSLLSLSNELIFLVAQELESQKDLSALVQVNRQCYLLLKQTLYRHNINHHSGHGILFAAKHGSLSAVRHFIDAGYSVRDCPHHKEITPGCHSAKPGYLCPMKHPILYASEYGHADLVKYLLRHGSDVFVEDCHGKNPIHLAARNGFLSVVEVLLNEAGDPTMSLNDDNDDVPFGICASPIQEAAFNGHQDVVEYLLSHSASPRDHANISLPAAGASGDITLVTLLLLQKADINFQHVASHIERNGMNPYQEPWHGPTALALAAQRGHTAMVEFLLDNGADIHCKMVFPYTGPTPLTLAVENEQEDIVKVLLDRGANIYGGPLSTAIVGCNIKMTELLLTKFEHVEGRLNPLVVAVRDGDMDIFRFLLDRGFNQEEALVEAIEHDREEIVNILLERGTDPDVPSVPCTSAVSAAIVRRNGTILRNLLQYGAHIHPETLKFTGWQSPEDIAALAKQFPILTYSRKSMHPPKDNGFQFI